MKGSECNKEERKNRKNGGTKAEGNGEGNIEKKEERKEKGKVQYFGKMV